MSAGIFHTKKTMYWIYKGYILLGCLPEFKQSVKQPLTMSLVTSELQVQGKDVVTQHMQTFYTQDPLPTATLQKEYILSELLKSDPKSFTTYLPLRALL